MPAPSSLRSTVFPAGVPSRRGSLSHQLTWRLITVFLLVALLGSLAVQGSYRVLQRRAQADAADLAAQHIQRGLAALQDTWLRNADEVKAQIDFMRLFADGPTDGWLRLRAYFAALEGKLDRFPSGVVLGEDGRVLFHFGGDGLALGSLALGRHLEGERTLPNWYYSSQHRTASMLVTVPLWLGVEGTGRLVLMQPLNNAALRQLAPPDVHLLLVFGEQAIGSSKGSQGVEQELDARFTGRLEGDPGIEQRVLAAFGEEADAPQLVMQQRVRELVPPRLVLVISTVLLGMLTLLLWLVIGRWARRLANRVGALSSATSLFANEHAMGEKLIRALEHAQSRGDEIGAVAQSSRALMEGVLAHDREHFAYLQTLDILEEGVVELDAEGRLLRASPGWFRLIGSPRQSEGLIYDSIHPEEVDDFRQHLGQLMQAEKSSLTGRMRLRREDGKDMWVEYRFIADEVSGGRVGSVRGVLRDITQSYLLEKHVTHMALHDALTGLPNRVLLEDRCKIALRTAGRNGNKVALGFMDMDHFKHVNDQFGHKVGDALLLALSGTLRHSLRSGDTLARWGGDEFVVLLPDLAHVDDARLTISKLLEVCGRSIKIDGNEFNSTFSLGVAIYPDDADTVETLLSQADRAMFAAKQQGRNTVCFFADIVHREPDRKAVYIQNRLTAAIKAQQIQTWFQPIVDARTQRVVGCEALARWHDETYGWVSPATFVPMAENLGLIREIGQQVWKQAIENLHRWREQGMTIKLSVNVSRRQLFTSTFTSDLLEDLDRLAIPASAVDLEITESVAMEEAEHTTRRLAELTLAGFGIAIDDFGTGYSSLSQLHDMPASVVKIDTSFVRRVHGERGAQLIQAIVKIASAFKLLSVAEGVEDAETAATLQRYGVDLLQGYHFGHPMNAESFERYLRAHFQMQAS